jgi:hypothetical protein
MKRFALLGCAAASVSACSTPMAQGAGDTVHMTRVGMKDAVVAPLRDFNLMRETIPPVLLAASEDPYKLPGDADCPALEHEIRNLDLALGPDADMPRGADKPTMRRRASHAASDAALDAVRDVTTGWIPFRSTVRRLTGASHHEDQKEDATQAGVIRRAYLKGLGLHKGCAYPAAPMPGVPPILADNKPAKGKRATPAKTVLADNKPAKGESASPAEAAAAPADWTSPTAPLPEAPPPPPLVLQPAKVIQQIPAYDPPVAPGG